MSSYSKKKKRSSDERVASKWSKWEWKEEGRYYVRYRVNEYGEVLQSISSGGVC